MDDCRCMQHLTDSVWLQMYVVCGHGICSIHYMLSYIMIECFSYVTKFISLRFCNTGHFGEVNRYSTALDVLICNYIYFLDGITLIEHCYLNVVFIGLGLWVSDWSSHMIVICDGSCSRVIGILFDTSIVQAL